MKNRIRKFIKITSLFILLGAWVSVPAVNLEFNLVPQGNFTWSVPNICAANSSSGCSSFEQSQCGNNQNNSGIYQTGSAPATDVCFGLSLLTQGGFATANASVAFDSSCSAAGFSPSPPFHNDGGELTITFHSASPVTKNTKLTLYLTQKTPSPNSEFTASCAYTQTEST